MKIDEFINILRTIDGVVMPDNIIEELSKIKDKQIEKAVQVMLQQLDRPGKKVKPKERAQK